MLGHKFTMAHGHALQINEKVRGPLANAAIASRARSKTAAGRHHTEIIMKHEGFLADMHGSMGG